MQQKKESRSTAKGNCFRCSGEAKRENTHVIFMISLRSKNRKGIKIPEKITLQRQGILNRQIVLRIPVCLNSVYIEISRI